ncbi:MAG: methyl-accepting chemotaxis protein [Oscillospiraceae bacterium]|jgi:methyl-accepting chemotaxis protein|nr:methyl-accepting chemotaxis protein [Oscillospiraceae bacterium]
MKNLKVAMKLAVGFGTMIVLSAVIGAVGIIGLISMRDGADYMFHNNLQAIEALGYLRENFGNQRSDLRNIFLSKDDPARVNSLIEDINRSEQSAESSFALYEATITRSSEETDYFAAKDAWKGSFGQLKNSVFSLVRAGNFDEAYTVFTRDGAGVVQTVTNGLAAATEINNTWADEGLQDIVSTEITILIILIAVVVFGILFSVVMGYRISGMISKPLKTLTGFMERAGETGDITLHPEEKALISHYSSNDDEIGHCVKGTAAFIHHVIESAHELDVIANGDLTLEIEISSDSDMLGISLKKMVDSLTHVLAEINNSTDQVSDGSKQIADGAQSLAQGSTQQAAAVEQLSSSITEIAHKTKENSEMASKAANLAHDIKDSAVKGSQQMDEMMSAVKDINAASQSISKVIKVIDDIAFQTNILALNAAVEAARAGQHGKGFAVVAEEVRSLASKSAEAAKDTGALIANSMEKAELGSRIAHDTAESLEAIVSGINESTQIVADIAKSSEEQSLGIAQINKGIDQVAQVVQQNSATAEESAAASEEMSGQAAMLGDLVHQFKLKTGASTRTLPKAYAPKAINMPTKPQTTAYTPTGGAAEYGKY